MRIRFLFAILGAALAACGSSDHGVADAPSPIADADVVEDAGPDTTPSPEAGAGPFVFPRAATTGGPVIAKPKLVVVTFADETLEPSIAQFSDALRTSTYFADAGKEYGVGAITSVTHVRLTANAPVAISDAEVRAWLGAKIGSAAPLGAADPAALYAIFYPGPTTVAYAGKTSCHGFGGYHGEIDASGTKVGFAVLPRCPATDPGVTDLDVLTRVASHELFEWATDPFPISNQAWHKVVPDSMAWGIAFAGELADLCDGRTSQSKPADLGFMVQSLWSNQASLAGHAPCQPAAASQFVTAIPKLVDDIVLSPSLLEANSVTTTGKSPALIVAASASVTVPVHLYSDVKPTARWKVSAVEGSTLPTAGLTFAFDRSEATAGEDIALTIKAPADFRVPAVVVLYVTRSNDDSYPYTRWPFIVSPKR